MTTEHPEAALPDPTLICRTCLEPLTRIEAAGKVAWSHRSIAIEHAPDPIPWVESEQKANLVCDFCSEPAPGWAYPVDVRTQKSTGFTLNTDGWWTACDACADRIDQADRMGLVEHAAKRLHKHSVTHSRLPMTLVKQVVSEGHAAFWNRRDGSRHLIRL